MQTVTFVLTAWAERAYLLSETPVQNGNTDSGRSSNADCAARDYTALT